MSSIDFSSYIICNVNHKTVRSLLDTGSVHSIATRETVERVGEKICPLEADDIFEFRTANSSSLPILGSANINIYIGGLAIPHKIYVVEHLTAALILGTQFLQQTSGVIDYRVGLLTLFDGLVQTKLVHKYDKHHVARLTNTVTIEPGSEMLVRVKIPSSLRAYNLIACSTPGEQFKVWGVARCLTKSDKNGHAFIRILNPRSEVLVLGKNRILAKLIPVNIENDGTAAICKFADVFYIQTNEKHQNNNVNLGTNSSYTADKQNNFQTSDEILEQFVKEYGITIGEQLNPIQRRLVLQLLFDYKDVFARTITDIEPRPLDVHIPVEVLPHRPWNKRNYPMSMEQRKVAHEQITGLEKAGIIERAKTFGYNCPILLIRKSSGAMRFISDLRLTNSILKAPSIALPSPQQILGEVSSRQPLLYTTIDLHQGYFNYLLPENLRKFTRFENPQTGVGYVYRSLPQGLGISPAMFVANINQIFAERNLSDTFLYMDDILLCTRSVDCMLGRVKQVLALCRDHGLKISPTKLRVCVESTDFLGFTLTKHGIQPKISRHQLLKQARSPHNKKSLMAALGFLQFYRKFIWKFSLRTQGMRKLLTKDTKFEWTDKLETEYRALLSDIFALPTLAHIDKKLPFVIYVDSSRSGAASVILQQSADGTLQPIGHMSRSFPKAIQHYSTPRLELLALDMVCKEYQIYFLGSKVFCYSDAPLTKQILQKSMSTDPVVARIIERLMEFDIVFRHVGTKTNPADALSRWPEKWTEQEKEEWSLRDIESEKVDAITTVRPQNTRVMDSETLFAPDQQFMLSHLYDVVEVSDGNTQCDSTDKTSLDMIQERETGENDVFYDCEDTINVIQADADDPVIWENTNNSNTICFEMINALHISPQDYIQDDCLSFLYTFLQDGKLPADTARCKEVLFTHHLYRLADDGRLYRLYFPRRKRMKKMASNQHGTEIQEVLCIPKTHQLVVLKEFHDASGHYSDIRFLATLRLYVYWKTLYKDAIYYAKSCDVCQKIKPNFHRQRAPLHPVKIATKPWDVLHLDHFKLARPIDGFTNILICVDQFSSYTILLPVKTLTALELSKNLLFLCSVFPKPNVVYSDNGTAFTAQLFGELLRSLNIKHLKISSQHPQSNAMAERKIQDIKTRLRATLETDSDILGALPLINLQVNTAVCSVRRFQPMEIVFGEKYNRLQYTDTSIPKLATPDVADFLLKYKQKMSEIWQQVRSNIDETKIRDEQIYNKRFKTAKAQWKVGESVLLQKKDVTAHSDKVLTAHKWIGPFKICAEIRGKAGPAYRLCTFDGKQLKFAISSDRLKKYNERSPTYFDRPNDGQETDSSTQNDVQTRQRPIIVAGRDTGVGQGVLAHPEMNKPRWGQNRVERPRLGRTRKEPSHEGEHWHAAIKILKEKKSSGGRKSYFVLFADQSRSWCLDVSEQLIANWQAFKQRRALRRRKCKRNR